MPKLQAAGWEDEPHRLIEQGTKSARLGVLLTRITAEAKQVLAQLTEGTTLEGPHWTEPVKILTANARGTRIEIQAAGIQTKRLWRVLGKT